jgi:hypothetical protein
VSSVDLGNIWHSDHHVLHLRLQNADLIVEDITCPGSGECVHQQTACVVKHFINRFGLECNVGSCAPVAAMEIAWTIQGDHYDLDQAQVWVIPLNDEVFASWLDAQQ